DVGSGAGLLKNVGIAPQHLLDQLDLLERLLKGRPFLGRVAREINAPELCPDVPLLETGDVGLHRLLRLADVALVERAAGLGPHFPREIVMTVEDERGRMDAAAFVGEGDRLARGRGLSPKERGAGQKGQHEGGKEQGCGASKARKLAQTAT